MKKVVLIRPFFSEVMQQLTYPIGLGYLASFLRESGYWVKIYDLSIYGLTNEQFLHKLEKINPDFIGITAITCYYPSMRELSNLIKKSSILKKIPLILGGVHVSSLPEGSIFECLADFVVIGEGEITLVDLLKSIENGTNLEKVNGIGYLKGNEYIQTKNRDLIKDLDTIPLLAWDLIYPEKYPLTPHGFFYKKSPIFPIFSSRGCPFQCTYCASSNFWKNRIRFHSIKRIVDDIEFLVKKYGAKEIQMWDDNFTLKRDRLIGFCKEILRRGLKLNFSCPNGVKIDTLDKTLLRILKKTGFYSLVFAIESGSEKIQRNIKKNLDLQIVPPIIQEANKLRFFNKAFFIYGLPTENLNDIYTTINFALKLKLDFANFFIFNPLPGSAFFSKWIKKRDVSQMKWNFDFFNNPQNMKGFNQITNTQIKKMQKYFIIKFYLLRPWKIFKYFSMVNFAQYPIMVKHMVYHIKNLILNSR
jgi:radical SAM superfamily enzyme YgiQ (UPF0313 family)